MSRVVLFGDRQVADLAHFYLTHDSEHEIVAFTVDGSHITADAMRGLPIVPFEEIQTRFPPHDFDMFIAVGSADMNGLRRSKYRAAKERGYGLISYVNSRAITWPGLDIGDNCFVLDNTVIQPFARIGHDVVVWSGCHIGHHSIVGDDCFLSPQVVVASNVTVEPRCLLGAGATVRDGITLGRESFVGAGSLIMKDTQPRQVFAGQRGDVLPWSSDRLPAAMLRSATRQQER